MKGKPPKYNPAARPSAGDVPCHGCEDRDVGCHGKCDAYADWRKRIIAEGHAIKHIIAAEADVTEYQIKQCRKQKRRIHNA